MRRIGGITYVLDEFHLKKYLKKISYYLGEQAEETREELVKIIRTKGKKEFEEKSGGIKKENQTSKRN